MWRVLLAAIFLIPAEVIGQTYGSEFTPRHPSNCHQVVRVLPRVRSLDTSDPLLKVDFILFNSDSTVVFPVTGLMVTKGFNPKRPDDGDSLVFRIENERGTDSISFPKIPNQFVEVPAKKDRPKATRITKNEEYEFYFRTPMSCYGGQWHYDKRYAEKDYRWLFTQDGYYAPPLSIQYTPWSRKDVLEIALAARRMIDSTYFKVIDQHGDPIGFDLVIKRNPTRTIILALHRDPKKYENFDVLISNTVIKGDKEHTTYFKFPMNAGSRSTVGIAGKYNGLEK
jgi:hypothetical protein